MFEIEQFIADCKLALSEDKSSKTMREIVKKAVSDPTGLMSALGEPEAAGVNKLYHSADLTILNLVWGAHMTLQPHNHNMWAVIGIYTGAEDNIFWRNTGETIEPAAAKALRTGDVTPLGKDIIHSVTNPIPRLTGALHVYAGDFFEEPRSEWDAQTLQEQVYDAEKTVRLFAEANERFVASTSA